MNECSENNVCSEKFKNIEKRIEQIEEKQDKLEERLANNEKTVSQIDNQLSIKLIQLEAKLDYHTKIVGEKVDNLAKEVEKKMDEYFKPKDSNSVDTFKEWGFKIGIKVIEYGLVGGILYAVAKGLSLL